MQHASPVPPVADLARATPESQGISSAAILSLVEEAARRLDDLLDRRAG